MDSLVAGLPHRLPRRCVHLLYWLVGWQCWRPPGVLARGPVHGGCSPLYGCWPVAWWLAAVGPPSVSGVCIPLVYGGCHVRSQRWPVCWPHCHGGLLGPVAAVFRAGSAIPFAVAWTLRLPR